MQDKTESYGWVPPHRASQKEVDEMYHLLRTWNVDLGDEGGAKWVREGGLFWMGRFDAEGRRHGVMVATHNTGRLLYQGRAFHGYPTGVWKKTAVGAGYVVSRHPKPAEGRTHNITCLTFDERGVRPPSLPMPIQVPIIEEELHYPSEAELADMDTPEFAEREFTVTRVCYGPGGSISTFREEIVKGKSLKGVGVPFLSDTPSRPHGRSYSFHAPGPNGEQGPLWKASYHIWPDFTTCIETFDRSGRIDDGLLFAHCGQPLRCKVQHPGRNSKIFQGTCGCKEFEGAGGRSVSWEDIPDWAMRPADSAGVAAVAKAFRPADDLYDIKTMPDGSKRMTCPEWHQ